jgi:prepilin-type N-terminal cleavage/methylation domain-containing protein
MIRNSLVRRARAGFTLIEMVVVVAILVVLTGMVIPKLDVFKMKANKGVAAANMAGVDRYIETFRVQRDVYPDHFDSLLNHDGTTLSTNLETQTIGPPPNPVKLTTATIVNDTELRSLNRVGITTVQWLDDVTPGVFPSNSGTITHVLATNDTVATVNASDPDGLGILVSLYPNSVPPGTPPAGSHVIVFGVGPRSDMIGYDLHSAPFYANADQTKYYTRMFALFQANEDGSRASYLGSIGADGDILGDEVADYYTE